MHGVERHEQCLNGRVIGNAATSHRVALHAIHKNGNAAIKRIQELCLIRVALACLAILMVVLEEEIVVRAQVVSNEK